ncbi:MAG: lysophospholipid acyltransferase family protein [Terrimicrobiaceae bacterium]
MSRHTDKWAYRYLYTDRIFSLTSWLFPKFGRSAAHCVTRAVASFYAATQKGVVQTVHENLKLLDPDIPEAPAKRLFRNYAMCISDYIALHSMDKNEALALCGEFVGKDHVTEAARAGGAILATGHFGFFEYGGVVLSTMGLPVTAATMAEPTPGLSAWRANWRTKWGGDTIQVGGDPFSSLIAQRALAAGRLVAMLADRPMGSHGIPVDLPGGQILFSSSPAVLSLLTGAPIIPVAVSLRADRKYRVVALPPVRTEKVPHALRNQEIARCTQALATALFSEIFSAPDQWFQFVPVRAKKLS